MSTALASLRTHTTRIPLWRRVLAVADGAVEQVRTLWTRLMTEARTRLRDAPLEAALAEPQILDAHRLLSETWSQTVEVPARRLLPPIAAEALEAAARVTAPDLQQRLGQPVTFTTGLAETEQWILQYVGTQIRDISATTLRSVQQVLREGWQSGQAPEVLAQRLEDVLGLTPRQQQTLGRLRTRLEAEGQSPTQVSRAIERAAQVALRQRALTIARTESVTLAQRGAWEALEQSVRQGVVEEARIRRHWQVNEDARLCPFCAAVPALNPEEGIGLYDLFQTPWGPLLLPPGHPLCRCADDVMILPG